MTETSKDSDKIIVKEVCGANAVTGPDGIMLNELILSRWEASKTIEVDFTGVAPSVPFLDEGIGRLVLLFKKEEIIAKLKLTGLSVADRTKLNGVVVNRYHALTNSIRYKKRR
jgi:hypothetical protein